MRLDNFISGLQIIRKYETDSYCIRAEHDQFWASSCDLQMSVEDTAKLEELGWFKDHDADGWSAFI